MPSIPVYRQQVLPSGTLNPAGGRIPSVGPGLQALGDGLAEVASVVAAQRERAGRAHAAETLASAELRWAELVQASRMEESSSPEGHSDRLLRTLGEDLGKTVRQAKSPGAAAFMRERLLALRSELGTRAMRWEAEQRVAANTRRHATGIETAARAVELDPSRRATILAEQLAALDAEHLPAETRAELRERAVQTITTSGLIADAKRDGAAMLARLKGQDPLLDDLRPDSRARVQAAAEDSLVAQRIEGIIGAYNHGPAAGLDALTSLDGDASLDPALRSEIRRGVNDRLEQRRGERRQQNAQALASIERSLANGSAGRETARLVDRLYGDGTLTPSEYANLHGQIEGVVTRRSERDAVASEMTRALESGIPLDPNNGRHREALAAAFDHDTHGTDAGSVPWQQIAVGYAARTRMLPAPAAAWARQALRSPDARLAAQAASFYGAVRAGAPDAADGFDADSRSFAGMVSDMLEAGTPDALAVETARASVFDLKPEVRERRRREYSEHDKQNPGALASFVDQDFDPGLFATEPAASEALKADFSAQAGRYYSRVGNIDLARRLAWSDLKRVYGPTRVNGEPVLMPLPVERFGVRPEEVREDIAELLRRHPLNDGTKPEDVIVVPDALTLRQLNDALDGRPIAPSYALTTPTGELVRDSDGVPQRYIVPTGEALTERVEAAKARAAEEARSAIEGARREREALYQRNLWNPRF